MNELVKKFLSRDDIKSLILDNSVKEVMTEWAKYARDQGEMGSRSLANYFHECGVNLLDYAESVITKVWIQDEYTLDYNIPQGVEIIGPSSFEDLVMRSATIPESVRMIAKRAFAGSLISELRFDPSTRLNIIDIDAFLRCERLSSVVIPSIREIRQNAFYGCDQLNRVELPSDIKIIGKRAFSRCPELKEIIYHGTIVDWDNILFDSTSFDAGVVVKCIDGVVEV